MDPRTIKRLVDTELEYRHQQSIFFQRREKTGPIVTPEVWVPVWEPMPCRLGAIFIEPGAFHLVFLDEIAPEHEVDEEYRKVRQEIYGRTTDVESVEVFQDPFISGVTLFNNASFINIYETSMHFTWAGSWERRIYSNTWNHMLSVQPNCIIEARGGYGRRRHMESAEVIEGTREEAELWRLGFYE